MQLSKDIHWSLCQDLANTFVLSDMKAQYWGSHMPEAQTGKLAIGALLAIRWDSRHFQHNIASLEEEERLSHHQNPGR